MFSANYPTRNWANIDELLSAKQWDRKSVTDTLIDIANAFRSENKKQQDNLAKKKREAIEPTVVGADISFSILSAESKDVAGTWADLKDTARTLPANVSTMFVSARDPKSSDPNSFDPAAVKMIDMINDLVNSGAIDKAARQGLVDAVNTIRQESNDNTVSKEKLDALRANNEKVAEAILALAKGKVGDATTAKELLKAFNLKQAAKAKADLLLAENGGKILGLDLGVVDNAAQVIEALTRFDAARLEMSDAAKAKELFANISKQRSDAIIAHKIAKESVIAVIIPADVEPAVAEAIAEAAAQNNIKVHVVANDEATLAKRSNLISRFNAAVVSTNKAVADVVKKDGTSPTLVASFNSIDKETGTLTRMNIASNNTNDLFDMISKRLGLPVETPQSRFNTGTHKGQNIALNIVKTKADAEKVLGGLNKSGTFVERMLWLKNALSKDGQDQQHIEGMVNNVLLTVMPYSEEQSRSNSDKLSAAKEALYREMHRLRYADKGDKNRVTTLDGNEAYGLIQGFIGTALLVALTDGKITEQALDANVPLRNLLAEAFIKGATLEQLGKVLDMKTESEPKEANGEVNVNSKAHILWTMLQTATIGDIANVIYAESRNPASTLGEDIPADYLTLAARAMLFPLMQQLNNFDIGEATKKSMQINVETMAKLLQAA